MKRLAVFTTLLLALYSTALAQGSIDISLTQQLSARVSAEIDLSLNSLKSIDESEALNHLNFAPNFSSSGSIRYWISDQLSSSLNYSILREPIAEADNTFPDEGFFVLSTSIAYSWKIFEFSFSLGQSLNPIWHVEQFELPYEIFDEPDLLTEAPNFSSIKLEARLSIGIKL